MPRTDRIIVRMLPGSMRSHVCRSWGLIRSPRQDWYRVFGGLRQWRAVKCKCVWSGVSIDRRSFQWPGCSAGSLWLKRFQCDRGTTICHIIIQRHGPECHFHSALWPWHTRSRICQQRSCLLWRKIEKIHQGTFRVWLSVQTEWNSNRNWCKSG